MRPRVLKLVIKEFVTNPLQKVDFKYNIRGWLKEINDINTSVQSSGNSDLFSFKLNYNTVENADGYTGTSLYNGNISETYWRSSSDAVLRKYGYQYDNLNRMTNSIYQKPENAVIVTNSYNESLAYDKNGNITALQRYGALDDAIYPVLMDDLVYTYNITGNKPNNLINVADNTNDISGFMDGTNTDADYSYDDNGNMIVDKNKNINSITYNHLNLPIRILFGNGNTIEYLYNAIGQKLNKIVREGAVSTKTEYLSGFQYKNEVLKFFSHAEGYVNYIPASGRGTVEAFNYAFNYTDHLGNIRLTYGIDPTTNVLKIMEENHYYPFGLKHTNYNTQYNVFSRNEEDQVRIAYVPPVESFYKYRYNSKEYQDELGLNVYDYHFRMYDPAIGRMLQIDPHASDYGKMSPYNYAFNNPVLVIDPDGRDGIITGSGTIDNPYVVTANYYYYDLNADQKNGLTDSIAAYNNKGKAFEIKDADGNKMHVKFNLTAIEVDNEDAAKERADADVISSEGSDGKITNAYFGNTVTDGPAGSSTDLGSANNRHINFDSSSVNSLYNSPNPTSTRAEIYKGVGIHEIGHNLGGNHNDPGSIMIAVERSYNSGAGLNQNVRTDYTLPGVNTKGVTAIIGRGVNFIDLVNNRNAGYDQTYTRTFGPKENKRIIEGSVGRLVFTKN